MEIGKKDLDETGIYKESFIDVACIVSPNVLFWF